MTDSAAPRMDAARACARYEAVRARLPAARFPARAARARSLAEIAEAIDVFVLDGFGVLNVGERAVPGAVERIAALQAAGKRCVVLTNGATLPTRIARKKYDRFGFAFGPEDVVSSRDAMAAAVAARPPMLWGFAATEDAAIEEIAPGALLLGDDPEPYERAEAFALLSANAWTPARQALLLGSLKARPRPVVVGNPDLVAPREDGLSLEPGFFAHEIADATGVAPAFYGKPFPEVFAIAAARIGAHDPARVAMVGDTLHTDILGGAARGWRTVLVLNHGLLRTLDADRLIGESGIVPDFVVETT